MLYFPPSFNKRETAKFHKGGYDGQFGTRLITQYKGSLNEIKRWHTQNRFKKHTFSTQCIKLWNSLPQEVTEAKNLRVKEELDISVEKNIQSYHD